MTKSIPIFIVNFNRLISLRNLITILRNRNYDNIIVIDNKSTYGPLLEYYDTFKSCPSVNIYYMTENKGPYVLNELLLKGEFPGILEDYYVYTDSDIVPIEDIPYNFIEDLVSICEFHKVDKVGLSLKIDDLPDHYNRKEEVINWESSHWKTNGLYNGIVLYDAPIDTTFSICAPNIKCSWASNAIRTGLPYMARHIPWYVNSNNLPDDEQYMRDEIQKNMGKEGVHQTYHWSTK